MCVEEYRQVQHSYHESTLFDMLNGNGELEQAIKAVQNRDFCQKILQELKSESFEILP
jgi:hypothetical protein